MKDTIKVFQKVLDKIFNHILIIFSPSVAGCKEAITRIKNTKTGPLGKSIELEGDFSDLYSNCNEGLLLERAEKECKYTDFHESTFLYIQLLIKCIMSLSYFKELSGIFKP